MPQIADELRVTYTDILSLGESHQRMELFDGDFVMSAMPSPLHQFVAINLGSLIHQYVREKKIGRVYASVDVYLSEVVVLQPDICFLSGERSFINDGKKFNGAPDLVVEILSETTEQRDRTFKFREYARGGAKEYWLVSPDKKQIEVYQNSARGFQLVKIFTGGETLNSPIFPDINLSVEQVFQ